MPTHRRNGRPLLTAAAAGALGPSRPQRCGPSLVCGESLGPPRGKETAMQQVPYPVQFSVDYPDRPLNRLTTGFRIFVAIPILIVLGAVSGETWQWSSARGTTAVAAGAGGL